MLAKVLNALLSQISSAYRQRQMANSLRSRISALTPAPFERRVAGPRNCHVEDYLTNDVLWAAVSSCDIDWAEKHPISKVSFHKDYSKASQHEYLVFQCHFPNDPEHYYLKLERPRDDGQDPEQDNADIQAASSATESSYEGSPASFKKDDIQAFDRWQYISEKNSKLHLLLSFRPRDVVTILDVAVLASVANTASPFYQLTRRQCFWYAFATYEIILKVFGAQDVDFGRVVVNEEGSPENEGLRKQQELSKRVVERGKWYFAINDPQALIRDVDSLRVKFEDDLRNVKQSVSICSASACLVLCHSYLFL
jgi:hypothetical protein